MEEGHPRNKGFFSKLSEGFAHLFGVSDDEPERVTEEIKMMVSEGHEKGALEADEAKMINNIFEFSDKEASDIMTHRRHIIGVDVSMPMKDAAKLMAEERFSRYPVYEEDIDNIVGILHLKDIFRALMEQGESGKISEIMRQPYFVPDTQNIDALFKEMQQKKVHMAIVIDEYGQTAGIVAMEDILEEIVGNIFDEYDLDESYISKAADDTYIMKGMAPLSEVEEALQVHFEEDDFDTLNGLIISRLEHIPAEGERVEVIIEGYQFTVLSVSNNMIHEVRVEKAELLHEPEEHADSPEAGKES